MLIARVSAVVWKPTPAALARLQPAPVVAAPRSALAVVAALVVVQLPPRLLLPVVAVAPLFQRLQAKLPPQLLRAPPELTLSV